MESTTELRQAIEAKSRILHQVFEEAGESLDFSKVKSLAGDDTAKIEAVKAMNRELDELHKRYEARAEVEGIARRLREPVEAMHHPGKAAGRSEAKSLGALFIESKAYKAFDGRNGPMAEMDIDLKTLFRTGAGWAPESMRLPDAVLSAQRPIGVVDFFPQFPTSQAAIKYMEETTFTSGAEEKAEVTAIADADIVGEAALALTERTQPVEWLPVFLPVTIQQMEDVEGIEAYINQRLVYMLQARIDLQCIRGTGVTPLLLGTNAKVTINVQAKGTDPTPDAVFKAINMVRSVGFAEPSVMFAHPNDWQDIRLLRTADGVYIFGSPMDPGPERMWGIPVHITTAALENTITLGDYRTYAAIYTRRGVTLAVSDSHRFYFTRGTLAVRADTRLAVVHFRETAFARVTGV